MPSRERALYLEIVRGVVRRRVTLHAVLGAFCKRALRHVDRKLLVILEMGVYQLLMLSRIPEFAAVASTMDLLPRGHRKQRGFVNGILRAVARSRQHIESCPEGQSRNILRLESGSGVRFDRDVFCDPQSDKTGFLSAQHGLSRDALGLLMEQLDGVRLSQLLESLNRRPQMTLRLTGVGTASADDVVAELSDAVERRDDGLLLWTGGGDPSVTAPHKAGQVVVQGTFASRVAPLVNPCDGERILDLCGAPGGKSLHMSQLANGADIFVGVLDERGAARVKENMARCHASNLTLVNVSRLEDSLPDGLFDAILLDVPCSNSGVLNRRPFARHRLDKATQDDLLKVQESLLLRALRFGVQQESPPRIVYSTCSVLPEENELLVQRCVAQFPSFRVQTEIGAIAASAADDGGYAALLQCE